jgi:hypothetical protein
LQIGSFLSKLQHLKFLKLCAETACGRKFVRLPDPTVQGEATGRSHSGNAQVIRAASFRPGTHCFTESDWHLDPHR